MSNIEFKRKLPSFQSVKEMYPLDENLLIIKNQNDEEIKNILCGKSKKFLLIIGPCSADREDAVLDYVIRLRKIQEQVSKKIFIVPRIYTSKPRTTGEGYKGMLHQPNPNSEPDVLRGLISTRKLHIRVLAETGFSCADEMLYPEQYYYLSDIVSYIAVGARSVENQQHRLTASGLNIAVGMKNPTSGNLKTLANSILAAQHPHDFIYNQWEVETKGNIYAHAVLRGYEDSNGDSVKNYDEESLNFLLNLFEKSEIKNQSVIIDTNHCNSGKQWEKQIDIAKEVLCRKNSSKIMSDFIKGLMIESYLEDGCQPSDGEIYGKSITDPCLGFEKTEKLIFEIYDLL